VTVGRRANVVRRPTADCQFRSRSYSLRANTVAVMSIGSANLFTRDFWRRTQSHVRPAMSFNDAT
jgi:hypothetical protein